MKKRYIFTATLLLSMVAATQKANASENEYTVQPGDTLSHIAESQGFDLNTLLQSNQHFQNINLIFPGDKVIIPNGEVVQQEITQPFAMERQEPTVPNYVAESLPSVTVSNYDTELLAKIIHAEANGETFLGKVAIGDVIMNRVASSEFPNSIEGVIFQSGQFSPVSDGSFYNTPTTEDYQAADAALAAGDVTNGALFFYNPNVSGPNWLDTLTTTANIGNHVFKR